MDRDYLPHVAEMNRSGGADPGLADYGRTGTLQLSYVRLNRVRYSFCPVKLFCHLLLTGLILPALCYWPFFTGVCPTYQACALPALWFRRLGFSRDHRGFNAR